MGESYQETERTTEARDGTFKAADGTKSLPR